MPRRLSKLNFLTLELYNSLFIYPAPSNLNYFWNFGFYSLFCLFAQIVTGVFLAMHYVPDQVLAFLSTEHIMRDVNSGWLLRYLHANGASMFFLVVYVHIFRGLYYSSYVYPRRALWAIGVFILLVMIITAFLGYVLPWGQMSFWAATVITNLVSAFPLFGTDLVVWIWGGYSVDNATLNRFFSFHYLFPFIIVFLVFVHLVILHKHHSNNPLGIQFGFDSVHFFPYYIYKDLFGLFLFFLFFSVFVFFCPNYLGHTDNYILANPMSTPSHIVPEWYFLPFYAILRSIPDKLFGVLCLFFSIITLALLPYIHVHIPLFRSSKFRFFSKYFFWLMVLNCFLIGWLGSQPAEYPYTYLSQVCTIFYFSYFLVFLNFLCILEKKLFKKKN